MKITIDKYDFGNAFALANRKDQFSYEALDLLFEYFEQYEADTGTEIDLDVVAICCEYYETDTLDLFNTYPINCKEENPGLKDMEEAVREYLQENTILVGKTATGFVYAAF